MNWWLMILGLVIFGWGYNTGVFMTKAKRSIMKYDVHRNATYAMLNLVLGMSGILVLILVWSEV